MSLLSNLREIQEGGYNLTFRPSQVYSSVTGAYTIFSIDGYVSLVTLVGRITAAAGGVTTLLVTVNTIAADNAAPTAINGAAGTIVYVPLNTAGVVINAAGAPKTIATGTPEMLAGSQVAGPGLIVATYGTSTATMEWGCIWRKLSKTARVY
jgi:hypothetical protein